MCKLNLINEVHHMNAFTLLSQIENESVDLIFTDPPYWTLNKWRNIGTTTRLGGHRDKEQQNDSEWFPTITENELWEFMLECYRVLKKDRHCCIMCDGQTLKWVLGWAEEAGFSYYKPIVWDKVYQGMGYHFRNRHEYIVLLDKGKNQKPKNLGLPDIVSIPMIRKGYPTEKPVELAKHFIEQYTNPGDIVLDPFCGSGSTLEAALSLGCAFIGGDLQEKAVKLASQRLNRKDEQPRLELV